MNTVNYTNAYKVTTLKDEKILWNKNNWYFGTFYNERANKLSYWTGNILTGIIDYPIVYDNGQIVYDHPEQLPKYVKEAFVKYITTL